MTHFFRVGTFDIRKLAKELEQHPELWDQVSTRKQGVHQEMSDIWVRYNDITPYMESGDFRGFNNPHIPVWYPAWEALPSLRPILLGPRGLMARVQGEMLGGVLITRVPAGGKIKEHRDASWHVDYYDKFYISIKAPWGAVFIGGENHEELQPRPGECYRFDNRKPHSVENRSKQDRITLIACVRTDMFHALP